MLLDRKWLLQAWLIETWDLYFALPATVLKIKAAASQRKSELCTACFISSYVEKCNVIKCTYRVQPRVVVVEVKVSLLVQLHLKKRPHDIINLHRTVSGKKLRSLILGMNDVSGCFPPYSRHSSAHYCQTTHLLCLPQRWDFHQQQAHKRQNLLRNSQGQVTFVLLKLSFVPISAQTSRDKALSGHEECDQPSQCHTSKFTGDWQGPQPCPMASYLFNFPVYHVSVWGWLKPWSESKVKTLANVCPGPSATCYSSYQSLHLTVIGGWSWLVN